MIDATSLVASTSHANDYKHDILNSKTSNKVNLREKSPSFGNTKMNSRSNDEKASDSPYEIS